MEVLQQTNVNGKIQLLSFILQVYADKPNPPRFIHHSESFLYASALLLSQESPSLSLLEMRRRRKR